MSDCVKETLCTRCIHKEVCSIKMFYLDTLNKLPAIDSVFDLTLSCRHYSKEISILKTNISNYDPLPLCQIVSYSDSTNNQKG